MIQYGINGFGRIGRVILRTCLMKPDIEIAAINDPAIDIEYICYLIKFDSTHGKFMHCVEHNNNEIIIKGKRIKVFHEKLPSHIPWQDAGVQYVVEASGMFTTLEKASGHLASESVKRVIVTAPSVDIPMVILGVNDCNLQPDQKVISCTSSTLYCLAPIIKVLDDNYGVAEGFLTSIHAMTPSLKPLDGLCLRGKNWRDHRSIHQNIIPAATGACRALGKIIPRVKNKLAGIAFRVPIVNVSVLDLTVRLCSCTSLQDVIEKVEKASESDLKNIIKVSKEEAVSSDFLAETHSCILDADSSLQLKPNFFKLVCWYENEYSYACRVVDSVYLSENQWKIPLPLKSLKHIEGLQLTDDKQKEIVCSTSQDTALKFKNKTGTVVLRKPLTSRLPGSSRSYSSKNHVDIKHEMQNKISNDDKRNGTTVFHSCLAIPPQDTEEFDSAKANERLRILKNEFSKLVNITENLLKKSYDNKKLEFEKKAVFEEDVLGDRHEIVTERCKKFLTVYQPDDKVPVCCLSNTKSLNTEEDFDATLPTNILQLPIESCSRSTSPHKACNEEPEIQEKLQCKENYQITPFANKNLTVSSESISKLTKLLTDEPKVQENPIYLPKTTPTKEFQSAQVQCLIVKQHNVGRGGNEHTEQNINNINVTSRTISSKTECLNILNDIEKANSHVINDNGPNNNQVKIELNKVEQGIGINDEKADYPNEGPKTMDDTLISIKKCDSIQSISLTLNECAPSKSILCLKRVSPEQTLFSDSTSRNRSPDTTSLISGIENGEHKEDIYDKLDSISGTDSNISFQMNEKKSQVVHLSDLCSSLEDLTKLDKICKIIEISDEISNKLFGTLENSEGLDIRQKKWSFKDLCERIKLDNFCDNLFGKSTL